MCDLDLDQLDDAEELGETLIGAQHALSMLSSDWTEEKLTMLVAKGAGGKVDSWLYFAHG